MTTASPVAPDLKQVTAQYRDGLRRLIHTVTASPDLQNESCVSSYRQKTASLNDQVKEVRSRCGAIQNSKAEFQRLQKELQKRSTELMTAKGNLEALSQKVGEAAFRESLAGRLTEFPALQTRREIQRQIDELSQEKLQVDQASHAGFTDKAKQAAHSTALSGRVLLQKQKVASADKTLGSAVLELKQEEQVLAHETSGIVAKVREARKAISDCEENRTVTQRQLDDCRSHAVTLGIVEVDAAQFDAEYKKSAERFLVLECEKLLARLEFGQSLLSSTPDALPEHLRQLAAELNRLASEHPGSCNQPTVDKATVISDLKEQVSLLHEELGTAIFEKGLCKGTLAVEISRVAEATQLDRRRTLRQLGKAACGNPDPMMALTEPRIQSLVNDVNAIDLTIKELDGQTLVGTDGKAVPLSLGGLVLLSVIVILCCGVVTSVVKVAWQDATPNVESQAIASKKCAENAGREAKQPFVVKAQPGDSRQNEEKSQTSPNSTIVNDASSADSSEKDLIDKPTQQSNLNSAFSIKANDLLRLYLKDRSAANRNFKGKQLKVTGTINSIIFDGVSTIVGGPSLSFYTPGGSGNITCVFDDQKDLEPFDSSKPATVIGTCDGVLRGNFGMIIIVLRGCKRGEADGIDHKEETLRPVAGRKLKCNVATVGLDKKAWWIEKQNASLSSVKCVATEDQIVIDFDTDASQWTPVQEAFPLLVRIFDKNGQYLTHFTTSEGFTVFVEVFEKFDDVYRRGLESGAKAEANKWKTVLLKPKAHRLIYSVNIRDLRDASMIEIGFTER